MSVRYSTSASDIFTFNGIQSILGYEYKRILIKKKKGYYYFPHKRFVHYIMILYYVYGTYISINTGTTWKTGITKITMIIYANKTIIQYIT